MAEVRQSLIKLTQKVLATGLGLLVMASVATAAPDWKLVDLRKHLFALSNDLEGDSAARDQSVDSIADGIDWHIPHTAAQAMPEFVEPDEPALIGWTDLRLALVSLAQVYGGKDNSDILKAVRGRGTEALSVEKGVVTLSQLRDRLTNRHLGRDLDTGGDILRTPLVIGEEATLRLGPDDVLELSRNDGAFIVNYGRLEVFGGEISARMETEKPIGDFIPFIVSVGSGSAHLSGATMKRLGFGYTAKFSGFSIVAYPTMRPTQRTIIENTRFDELVTVALVGVVNAELRDSRFFDMRRNPLLVSRSQNALVSGNLFSGNSPTNAVRVWNGSDGTRLLGNIVLEGSQAGLVIGSGSDHVAVNGNLIWRRNGGGVKLMDVDCGRVENNLILDDKQKGVEIRSSRNAYVHANSIVGNRNAGVWVSAQNASDVTYVSDNLLRENGSGLTSANGADIAMQGNDFSDQFPRLLDGDITQQFRVIVDDLHGIRPILLNAAGSQLTHNLTPRGCAS